MLLATNTIVEQNISSAQSSPSALPLPEHLRGHGLANCLDLVFPQISEARQRVRRGAQRLARSQARVPFDPATVEDALAANLAEPLLTMMTRVMVLELNVARLEGRLAGDNSRARFQSFLASLRSPEVADHLLAEYPVLLEQVVNRLDQWARFSLEFLAHLCDDWHKIRDSFFADDPGLLTRIQMGAGDTHRDGHSVVIASFGSGRRLVYKPRSLAVDQHFQQLLGMLNKLCAQHEFRLLKIHDCGDYGWTEFVSAEPCVTAAEVDRFYRRQGGYLAILYALEASDFHCENLIASGEHPVLIDLEALFHPRLEIIDANRADAAAGRALGYSVMRIGLLPMRAWAGDGFGGVDMSGLGSATGQLTPHSVPQWENSDTDEMHVVRRRIEMTGAENRPSLNGTEVDVFDYAVAIVDGFTLMYRTLLHHREEWLSLVSRFAGDEVRVIVRPTRVYGELLHESFHPDVLRTAADRGALFDHLKSRGSDSPHLAPLLDSEQADLSRGDVPLFTTRPFSRDLWTSAGDRIEGYFEESGMTLVTRRIQQLSEKDLERQIWIVQASLATLASQPPRPGGAAIAKEPMPNVFRHQPARLAECSGPTQWIAAARSIGDRLEELAIGGHDDITWIGLVPAENDNWLLRPLGPDLYDGLPGVILFLAHLGSLTQEHHYCDLAKSALKALRGQIEDTRSLTSIGVFTGWSGVVYALTHLGAIWNDPALFIEAERLLAPIQELIKSDKLFDIIAGAAGCALALSSLQICRPSENVLRAVRDCGEHLRCSSMRMPEGIGWIREDLGPAPLTGFAHGNAGIAYALLHIGVLTGEARFAEVAYEALRYERSCFAPEHCNWPDLRVRRAGDFAVAWCHGAPGIGLARLCSLHHMDEPLFRSEIRTALETTMAQGFGSNHTLCHGDLGNLDVLLHASQVLHEPRWELHAREIAARILHAANENGWLCGNPSAIESPGLMTGLAGIGYELLRLAAPDRIPPVLSLGRPYSHD